MPDFPPIDDQKTTAHVKRVFRIDPNTGEIDPETWIDVCRFDCVPTSFRSTDQGNLGQVSMLYILWNDDPNDQWEQVDFPDNYERVQAENSNSARACHKRGIRNPDDPHGDHVDLWIVDQTGMQTTHDVDNQGAAGQGIMIGFNNLMPGFENEDVNTVADYPDTYRRKVDVIKVINNDLGGFKMANDDGSDPQMVAWDDYKRYLQNGATDTGQHMDVEVTLQYGTFWYSPWSDGQSTQGLIYTWVNNSDISALFDDGNTKAVDSDGKPCLFRTDPLQTIVNVGFPAGAVFVVGDWGGSSGRIEQKSKNNTGLPLSLGKLAFTDEGQIYGGTYAYFAADPEKDPKPKSLFLMCGTDNRAPGDIDQVNAGTAKFGNGIIVASRDGKTWDTVLKIEAPVVPGLFGTYLNWVQVLGLRWDGKTFYAGVHAIIIFRQISIEPDFILTSFSIDEHDILWSSPDGYTWRGIEQNTARVSKGEHLPKQGLLCDHCSDMVKDKFGNNVPDGIYHYSKDSIGNEIFIRGDAVPSIQWDVGSINADVAATTVTIEQTTVGDGGKKTKTTTTCVPGIPFLCLAYAGTAASGTIIVAGAEIAMSSDMGKTWRKDVRHVDDKGHVVIDGPLAYSGLTAPATTALAARLNQLPKTLK